MFFSFRFWFCCLFELWRPWWSQKNGEKPSSISILKSSSGTGTSSHKKFTKYFSTSFMDVWKDTCPNNRCSIILLVKSDHSRHKELKIWVLTDGNFLVINKNMSNIALSVQKGFRDLIIWKDKTFQNDKIKARLLDIYGRIIGRKSSIAVMCIHGSSRNPQVDLEAWLPFPFRCQKLLQKRMTEMTFFPERSRELWWSEHLVH